MRCFSQNGILRRLLKTVERQNPHSTGVTLHSSWRYTMTDSEVEMEIDKVEQELIDAVTQKDAATLDRLIADDFLIVGETLAEKLGDKQLYVADCLGSGPIENASASYDRLKLRVYGDTVIVNSIFKYQVTIEGKEHGGAF